MSRKAVDAFDYPEVFSSEEKGGVRLEIECVYSAEARPAMTLGLMGYVAVSALMLAVIAGTPRASGSEVTIIAAVLLVVGYFLFRNLMKQRLHLVFDTGKGVLTGVADKTIPLPEISAFSIDHHPRAGRTRERTAIDDIALVNIWYGPASVNKLPVATIRNGQNTDHAHQIRAACAWCLNHAMKMAPRRQPAPVQDQATGGPPGAFDWPV